MGGAQRKRARPRRYRGRYPLRVSLLTLLGALGIGIGAFAPAVRVDLRGTYCYWQIAGLEAGFVVVASALVLRAMPPAHHRALVWPTLLLWGALAYPFVEPYLFPRRRGFLGRIRHAVAREFQDVVTDLAFGFDMVHWQWGAAVFVAGCLSTTAAAVLARR